MSTTTYSIETVTSLDLDAAEHRVRELLAEEGFGILSEIDVAATLANKLGIQRPPYKILGACNPGLAAQALELDDAIGVLLPCNVVVHEREGETVVAAIEPEVMSSFSPAVTDIAREARVRLERVLRQLGN